MINNEITGINGFSKINSPFAADGFSKSFVSKETNGADFKSVLAGLVNNVNNEISKPDELLNAQMTGNPNVDIHDVMAAVAKAEIGVSLATQVTSKIVTAYTQIMNISI